MFPALLALFALVYALDRPAYLRLLREDGVVENATVVVLLLAMALSLVRACRVAGSDRRFRTFHVAFAALCLFWAAEELSWGQRIVDFASPEFFRAHARQGETNVHNVVEKIGELPTRAYVAVACLTYGVYLPIALPRRPRLQALTARFGLKTPPRFLAPGFALAALLQIDLPTGQEEEIGELFLGLCAALFMLAELAGLTRPAAD